jgi:plastocyanin
MRIAGTIVVAGVLAAALAAWTRAGADTAQIEIRMFQFRPGRLDVARGAEVVWTNRDDIRHTVTSGEPERRDGRFDVSLAGPGAVARVGFDRAGVHPYFCERHPAMRGAIHVQ